MKKILVAIVAVILVLGLFGCGKDEAAPADNETVTQDEYTEDAGETQETPEESEPADTADEDSAADADSDSDAASAVLSPEFKKTMDDYEAWFDHYCEVMKKYQENPSDLELMSEMTDLLTEGTKMLDQMEAMDQSEMNSAELAYYIEVTARIEKKLLEVADY